MGEIRQRVLRAALVLGVCAAAAEARKFFPDDPVETAPKPMEVKKAKSRRLNEYYDFFKNTFMEPGKKVPPGNPVAAGAVNTLGEVPDSAWYQNRHGRRPMTLEELTRGPRFHGPPADGVWQITAAKTEGVTPGFEIEDAAGVKFFFKFDPKSNPEMATAADVVASLFFYALGYNTPENYIVVFEGSRLKIGPKATVRVETGKLRPMEQRDIDDILRHIPRDSEGRFRALASRTVEGEVLGPFRFHNTRRDDPNDVVPHHHRRDLRGLRVFAAWLNQTDAKALNTLDTLVEEGGVRHIKHYLIDFGASLGSDSLWPKSPRAGHVYMFEWDTAAAQFLTLGLYTPRWMRADYPDIKAVGNFESEVFNPDTWKPNYPNPAFDNCLPDDAYWAARQIMRFTDEEIRAMVQTGQYSNPKAADYIAKTLSARRDRIGRTYFEKVLPLDHFRVRGGELQFENLAVTYGFVQPRGYDVKWHSFDNRTETMTAIRDAAGPAFASGNGPTPAKPPHSQVLSARLPDAAAEYLAAEITTQGSGKKITVYVRNRSQVVGVERTW